MREDGSYAVTVELEGLKDPNLTRDTFFTGNSTKDARLLDPVDTLLANVVKALDLEKNPIRSSLVTGRRKLDVTVEHNKLLGPDNVSMTLTLPRPALSSYLPQTQELYRRVTAALDAQLPAFEQQVAAIRARKLPTRDIMGQTANDRVARSETRALGGLDMEARLTEELRKKHGLTYDSAQACAYEAGSFLENEGPVAMAGSGAQKRLAQALTQKHGVEAAKAAECVETAVETMRRAGLLQSQGWSRKASDN
ncbi:MAG: hypothetical protein EBV03_05750 [Proteobacteria bacterium]|nr:hypothetical protein [Pseudomonadota bacterium]